MTKILIVTQDIQFSKLLCNTLSFHGFTVESAASMEQVNKLISEINFGLVIGDFSFFRTIGIQFYNDLNVLIAKPAVIMMGGLDEERDILQNMYKSMDDYILRPFGLSELKMIVNRQLDRKQTFTRPIIYGDLKIDVARSLVFIKNNLLNLGKKEIEILSLLAKKAGKIVTNDQLLTRERIDTLRKKLKASAGEVFEIKSVSGLGYKLVLQGR
jgi:DNA-binding response OmpR family regulator